MNGPQWKVDLDHQREVQDEAKKLPRGRLVTWVRALLVGAALVWFAAFVYACVDLPRRVPTHWSGMSGPDGWNSKAGALAFLGLLPALICFGLLQISRLVLAWPDGINMRPADKAWWLATPQRLVELERRLREDMSVLVASLLVMFACVTVSICIASHDESHHLPVWSLPVTFVVIGLGVAWVLVRALRGYGRPRTAPTERETTNA